MQTSNFDTECTECNQQIKDSENLYCRYCFDLLSNRMKQTKAQVEMLDNFLAWQHDHSNRQEITEENSKLDLELKQLEEQQRKLELELSTITRKNLQLEVQNAYNLHKFLDQAQGKEKSVSDVCQQLCFAEQQNNRLAEEMEKIKKVKVLQSFFELQGNKFNYNCTLDGVKLNYQNLYILLPLLSYVLKSLSPKGYQRKCISQIYSDEGILLVFEIKDGKRTRDKEISIQENAINWIRFLAAELKNICGFLKVEEKLSRIIIDLKNEKETIFQVCSSLKSVIENIDDLYFEY